jgi:hypothetical protein
VEEIRALPTRLKFLKLRLETLKLLGHFPIGLGDSFMSELLQA